jgi:hypothetical protein
MFALARAANGTQISRDSNVAVCRYYLESRQPNIDM